MHGPDASKRRKVQERRVELAIAAAGYTEASPGQYYPAPGEYRREHPIDFTCVETAATKGESRCRIDFVVGLRQGGVVFLEVDEGQHQYGYDSQLSCDARRVARVEESRFMAEVQAEVPQDHAVQVLWLRYNPDAYRIGGVLRRIQGGKAAREAWLMEFISKVSVSDCCGSGGRYAFRYAFYDREEEEDDKPAVAWHAEYPQEFKPLTLAIRALES